MMESPQLNVRYCHIFGIRFLMGGYKEAKALLSEGRLMVAPAAPSLASIKHDGPYYEALKGSDFALPDSSFMVFLIRLFKGIKLNVISGLNFLSRFLDEDELKHQHSDLFLVDPSEEEKALNQHYLLSKGIVIDDFDHYVAPLYPRNPVQDSQLLEILQLKKPHYILINLGGGVQEKLAFYLKTNLDYSPSILCTGAAIAFLTASQAPISPLMDNLHLGWLLRCLRAPRTFVPRYWRAFPLIPLIAKHKNEIFIRNV
jgi:N-acetylglucosaminyldiphosphoundecaprenol N-acetyl-beta-D-mannosaminyltransferase